MGDSGFVACKAWLCRPVGWIGVAGVGEVSEGDSFLFRGLVFIIFVFLFQLIILNTDAPPI